jgi:hypothetical protein
MIIDYTDAQGIKRRVELPEGSKASPGEGIPKSVDIDELYQDAPFEFRKRLVEELWNVGLIEENDFNAGDAPNRIRAALLAAIKFDTMSIISFVKSLRR